MRAEWETYRDAERQKQREPERQESERMRQTGGQSALVRKLAADSFSKTDVVPINACDVIKRRNDDVY